MRTSITDEEREMSSEQKYVFVDASVDTDNDEDTITITRSMSNKIAKEAALSLAVTVNVLYFDLNEISS
jgi:hypothetical protein